MCIEGIELSIEVVAEHAQLFESRAAALLDMTDGKMSIHPADKIKAKQYLENAAVVHNILSDLHSLKRKHQRAKSSKQTQ